MPKSQSNLDDRAKLVPNLSAPPDEHCLTSVHLTQGEVEEILKTLSVDKATGPDGISNRILREAPHDLSIPLCALYNHSLTSCVVPDIWKEAHVSAVLKKGEASLPRNYRPISSSSIFTTIFILATFSLLCNQGLSLETLRSTIFILATFSLLCNQGLSLETLRSTIFILATFSLLCNQT